MSARDIVEEVFTGPLAELIWTGTTHVVLPLVPQNFAVGSVLPAVFYMCRRGCRRGKGRFQETFSPAEKKRANIWYVAGKLSQDKQSFAGFESDIEKDILGDLLLCDALENKKHEEGHQEEIQRAFPVHFLASWLDLPPAVANLRFVPEMLVCLLANQPEGQGIQPGLGRGPFPIGLSPEKNLLFNIFAHGVVFGENPSNLCADTFDEQSSLSLEELLMVRLAQTCEESPETPRGRGAVAEIPNKWPVSQRAALAFRDDLTGFLQNYGAIIPRRSITPMLESLLGLGVFSIYAESCSIAIAWDGTGKVPVLEAQKPVPVFADASNGSDSRLRDLAEQSFDEVIGLLDQASACLMSIRILDAKGRFDRKLREFIPKGPDTSEWLNLLGKVRLEKHERSEAILNDLSEKIEALTVKLEAEGTEQAAIDILRAPSASSDPVRALADSLCTMMGDKLLRSNTTLRFIDSCLMLNEAHGLGRKRRVSRSSAGCKRKMMDVRSVILSNTVLETLVHLHLIAREGVLSFAEFLRILRERYGIWVDECPPGIFASREDLLNNRAMLERRLRDLGLLVGVNDAEFMKHLRPRFQRHTPT